jgi:SNF2 family DNA or RNA helicase
MINATLYDFQQRGVTAILNGLRGFRHGFLLCDDMGCGKTIASLAVAEEMKKAGEVSRVLIVAPAVSLSEWNRMIREFTDSSYVIVQDSRLEKYSRAFYTAMSIDRYRMAHEEIDKGNYDLLIFDEFHQLKDKKSQRSQAIRSHRYPYALMMSGTPILNRTEELWTALNYVDKSEWPSYQKFVSQYVKTIEIPVWMQFGSRRRQIMIRKPCGPKNVDDLRKKLAGLMIRRLKANVLKDLPEIIYQQVTVELSPAQRKCYMDLRKKLKADIGNKQISVQNALVLFMRLRQICDGLSTVAGSSKRDSAKLDALCTLAKDIIYGTHKAIIFTPFINIAEDAASRLHEYNPVLVTGNTRPDDVAESIKKFQNDPECKLYIGTIMKNFQSITLTAADYVIFVGQDLRPTVNEQALSRAHRIGQKGTVCCIKIVAQDTVDERVNDMLDKKSSEFAQVVEGKAGGQTLNWISRMI